MRGFVFASLLLILAACAEVKLSAPFDLTATPGPGLIRLSWQDTENEEGYTLYRQRVVEEGDEAAEDFEVIAETDADITSYDDKAVEVGASYLYRISARASGRESEFAESAESVSPKPEKMELTLVWRGAGGGEVTSEALEESCTPQDGECNFDIATDSELVLIVKPNASSVFGGWGGACKGNELSCTLTMDSEKRVEVTLNEAKRTLTVEKEGDGTGSVTSPQGLECDKDCATTEASFVLGNIITLQAVAEPGSAFRGWGGACSGQMCSVTLDEDKTVTATFESVAAPVIEAFEASDSTILRGESVQLTWTVTPENDTTVRLELDNGEPLDVTGRSSEFVTPSQTTTYKLVAQNTSGEANEALVVTVEPAFELEVATIGNTSGKVVGNDINCGNVCVNIFKEGQTVTLQATGAPFERWGAGCDEVRADECDVVMNAAKSIIAYFTE